MANKNPYHVIKHQHVTEKSMMLQNLKNATSNVSLKRCESPKYVFIVDNKANKHEIAQALEEIYIEKNIKVVDVNTINVKPKARRVRGRLGNTSAFKKAVVTLQKGDSLDNV
jgi:large subunit ribosomal protein L23